MFGFGGLENVWIWRNGNNVDLQEGKYFAFGELKNVWIWMNENNVDLQEGK